MNPVDVLIDHFEDYLSYFETNLVYDFDSHIQTMRCRDQFADVLGALENDEFLGYLRKTLSDWKLRRPGLLALDDFRAVLRQHAQAIENLQTFELGVSDANQCWEDIWQAIIAVRITRREPRLVSGTKLFHHLLPNLIVPIDRFYTGSFLYAGGNNDFQAINGERTTFRVAFRCFSQIAAEIRPRIGDYLRRHQAHTSISKVIDNAIMGFVALARQQVWGV